MWVLCIHYIIEYSYCKIRRISPLSENQKRQISAYKLEEKSVSFIARKLSWSRTVMRNYLKDPESYTTRKCPGRPSKITNAARRRLFREVSKGKSSSRYLQKSQNLPITSRRVRQLLHESPNLVYRNRKTTLARPAKHKNMRKDWVKKKVTWTKEKWETVVLSDAKEV